MCRTVSPRESGRLLEKPRDLPCTCGVLIGVDIADEAAAVKSMAGTTVRPVSPTPMVMGPLPPSSDGQGRA